MEEEEESGYAVGLELGDMGLAEMGRINLMTSMAAWLCNASEVMHHLDYLAFRAYGNAVGSMVIASARFDAIGRENKIQHAIQRAGGKTLRIGGFEFTYRIVHAVDGVKVKCGTRSELYGRKKNVDRLLDSVKGLGDPGEITVEECDVNVPVIPSPTSVYNAGLDQMFIMAQLRRQGEFIALLIDEVVSVDKDFGPVCMCGKGHDTQAMLSRYADLLAKAGRLFRLMDEPRKFKPVPHPTTYTEGMTESFLESGEERGKLICWKCSKPATRRCPECRMAEYCSPRCMRRDHEDHSTKCEYIALICTGTERRNMLIEEGIRIRDLI